MTDRLDRLNVALESRYRVERELGQGGMATVYVAHDDRHERQVAIKVLKPELAAVVGAERFLAEIKTTANLTHPNILPLHDSGETDGFLYYVMPYVEGESLRDRLDREEQLPVDEAVLLASDLAAALDHAHRKEVVHRDIKPANILLQDGRPVIADFGIALAVGTAGGARLTETGLSVGTPYYMSPEQALGDQPVTAASDIYALGCVLFEMLAGEPPHIAGTSQAVLARIITGETRSVREIRSSVPPNVDGAIRRALERLPADRFSTAGDFADALGDPDYRYGEDDETGRSPWPGRAAAAALGVAAGVVVGLLLAGTGPGSPESTAEVRPLQLTFSGQARRPAISPEGSFVALVDVACEQGSFAVCSDALQVKEVGSNTEVTLLEDAETLGSPRWTHDGATVVVEAVLADGRDGLFATPRMGGVVRSVAPAGPFDTHPAADSLVVVPVDERPMEEGDQATITALVVDLASGAVADTLHLDIPGPAEGLAWHPNGNRLAVYAGGDLWLVSRDGTLLDSKSFPSARPEIRWNVAGDGVLQFKVGTVREDDFIVHPVSARGEFAGPYEVVRGGIPTIYSGQFDVARETGRVVVATGDARADVWSFRNDGPTATATRRTGGTTWYGIPHISWDGATTYYQRGDAQGDNVYALNLETGQEEALTASTYAGGYAVLLSTRGDRLAYVRASAGGQSTIETLRFPSRRTSATRNPVVATRPTPFGEESVLVIGSGTLGVMDTLGAELRPLGTAGYLPLSWGRAAVSPDGQRMVYPAYTENGDQALVFRGLDGGPALEVVPLGDPDAAGVVWTPEGTLYVGRWRAEEANPSLWRWDEAEGTLVRLAEIPAPCQPVSITVDAAGRRGTCLTEESRWDIWAFEGLGL